MNHLKRSQAFSSVLKRSQAFSSVLKRSQALIGLTLFSILMISCENEPNLKTETQSSTYARGSINDPVGEKVILGNQLQNAYSVANMQAAFDYYNNLYPNSPYQGFIVTPNLQYIKITPATEADLVYLEDIDANKDDIFLSNYPLDYEVLQEGSEYTDPNYTGKIEFRPLYTVIPINATLDVPYEVLAKLYEPTEEEDDIETIALAMADWQDDLIADFDQEVTMNNVNDFIEAPSPTLRLFGRRYRPKGTIQMYIYDTDGVEGLMNAKIRTGRNFFWRTCYTNEVGYFEAAKKYRGKVRIRSAWRNKTATLRMAWYEMMGVQVSDHVMTETRGNNNRTYVIKNVGDDVRLWCKGAVHNGIDKYNKFCVANSIIPVTNANIWVWKNGSGDASTTMLHQFQNLGLIAALTGDNEGTIWSEFINSIGGTFVGLTSIIYPNFWPDQVYTQVNKQEVRELNITQSNRAVEQLVFHESGHFSHALNTGAGFYSNVVSSELKNIFDHNSDPYYDGQSPTAGSGQLIALAEGWATLTENKCIQSYYGRCFDNNTLHNLPSYMENFTMYKTPFTLVNRHDNNHWFLSGLLWDISDNNSNEVYSSYRDGSNGLYLNPIVDNVFVNDNLSFIFNLLNSNVSNGYNLKQKLIQSYPLQATEIENLFTSYGY